MTALYWPVKDPAEVLDYTIDWSARLVSEVILTSVWTLSPVDTLAETTGSFTNTTTTVWLTGGVLGEKYTLTNEITTSGGRTMNQSVTLKLKTK